MDDERQILLASTDLMAMSQIGGLARSINARVETLRSLGDPPQGGPFDVVLVDLQAMPGDPAEIVIRVRALVEALPVQGATPVRIVAFGPHVHKQRLDQARAAGAEAVSRGELLGDFSRLLAARKE